MAHEAPDNSPSPLLQGKVYDWLKYLSLVFLPALATFVFGMSSIIPHAGAIVGIITSTATFLGALLVVSSSQYNKSDARFDGTLTAIPNEETNSTTLRFGMDPNDLVGKSSVTLKVKSAA